MEDHEDGTEKKKRKTGKSKVDDAIGKIKKVITRYQTASNQDTALRTVLGGQENVIWKMGTHRKGHRNKLTTRTPTLQARMMMTTIQEQPAWQWANHPSMIHNVQKSLETLEAWGGEG